MILRYGLEDYKGIIVLPAILQTPIVDPATFSLNPQKTEILVLFNERRGRPWDSRVLRNSEFYVLPIGP